MKPYYRFLQLLRFNEIDQDEFALLLTLNVTIPLLFLTYALWMR